MSRNPPAGAAVADISTPGDRWPGEITSTAPVVDGSNSMKTMTSGIRSTPNQICDANKDSYLIQRSSGLHPRWDLNLLFLHSRTV